eukprot:9327197-Lingulodinium_polyedra.AAC.1
MAILNITSLDDWQAAEVHWGGAGASLSLSTPSSSSSSSSAAAPQLQASRLRVHGCYHARRPVTEAMALRAFRGVAKSAILQLLENTGCETMPDSRSLYK